jgi:hypothetical protein
MLAQLAGIAIGWRAILTAMHRYVTNVLAYCAKFVSRFNSLPETVQWLDIRTRHTIFQSDDSGGSKCRKERVGASS